MNGNWQKYQNTNRLHQYFLQNFLHSVVDAVLATQPQAALDIGCAEGFVLHELSTRLPHMQATGIDIDTAALERGKQMFPSLDLQHGDGTQCLAEDNQYDCVLALEILEHLPEPEKLLAEVKRVSKKYCIFSVPHEPWFCLANLARGKNLSRFGNDIEHVNHWNPWSFSRLLQKNGFSIVKHKLPFPWMLFVCEV